MPGALRYVCAGIFSHVGDGVLPFFLPHGQKKPTPQSCPLSHAPVSVFRLFLCIYTTLYNIIYGIIGYANFV